MTDPVIPRQRLHPFSPVLKGFRLLAVVIVGISWQGLEQLKIGGWLLLVAGLLVALLAYSYIAWTFTGYEVVGRELRVHEGLLSRRVRAVPLERLQSIEVIQPFQARIFGLAELKLDVAGAERGEAPLAFLPVAQAQALRTQLLALAGGQTEPAVPPVETELFRVTNKDVVVSQFLTPPVMFTPVAILYIVGQLAFNQNFGIFTIASMLSGLFATLVAPGLRMANFWDFRVARSEDGKLRIQHGSLTARSQTVPVHRVQALTVTWPLLWRSKGWLRITLAVAGQNAGAAGEGGGRKAETDRLLPVATLEQGRAIVPEVMPGVDLAALPMTGIPRRARWLAPFRQRILVAGLTERVFASVDGYATRTLTIVPYERIQSVRISQGPWQRRLGLATVYADIAGGTPVSAPHRPLEEAYSWVTELAARAHRARVNT